MESEDPRVIFAIDRLYPEAHAAFTTWLRPVKDIVGECLVVLDTNVLLTPYTISPKSIDQIANAYRGLLAKNRLRIPGRVAREYARNRSVKLEELFQQLTRKRTAIPQVSGGRYPLLEPVPEYQALLTLEEELEKQHARYKEALRKVIDHVKTWTWDDPVSTAYADLFNAAAIHDPAFDDSDVLRELEDRFVARIPPGYKDGSKEDRGVGDLVIWLTILQLGEAEKCDLLFVSGDEKSDWWHRSEGQALYPRFELADEYRRKSDGHSFQIARFSTFLDLFGVGQEVVEEVRKEEVESRTRQTSELHRFREVSRVAERAVARWVEGRFMARSVQRGTPDAPDLLLEDEDGDLVGVEVFYARQLPRGVGLLRVRLRELAIRGHWWRSKHGLTVFSIAVVAEDEAMARELGERLRSEEWDIPETQFYVGCLDDEGDFRAVEEIRR